MTEVNGTMIKHLVDAYLGSRDFERVLASQDQYRYWLRVLCDTAFVDRSVGQLKYRQLTTPQAQMIYDTLSDRGITFANRITGVTRKMFNYAKKYGIVDNNPWSSIQTLTPKPRKVMWQPQDIQRFLKIAYSRFETRSVGLIAQMAYEWAQRIGDMRVLTWDSIDFENKVLNLEQSKRRAVVHLPISDDLMYMLNQQNGEFDWQPYVAPNLNSKDVDGYNPYNIYNISRVAKRILSEAGLNEGLRLSDLRRTATTEMVEAGVGIVQIMQVTGHQSPQSVTPYMKNTLTGATNALTLRSAHTAGATSQKDIEHVESK
jgi:integrase|tara:strand:+ start:3753 stop:4700 length:948 start_codon:yes stop_codon:yes gene_type:complete